MSSLLQFGGEISEKGVGLLFYATEQMVTHVMLDRTSLKPYCVCGEPMHAHGQGRYWGGVIDGKPAGYPCADVYTPNTTGRPEDACAEPVALEWGGRIHWQPRLYRAWRKPCGMFGPWVQFRYNGEVHAPDLSVPIAVKKLPRDAKPLTDEEAVRYWSAP